MVYDVTEAESFQNLEYWYNELNQRLVSNEIVMMVVGNKIDLKDDRVVTKEEGQRVA